MALAPSCHTVRRTNASVEWHGAHVDAQSMSLSSATWNPTLRVGAEVVKCQHPDATTTWWHERHGPLFSDGGYDWWKFRSRALFGDRAFANLEAPAFVDAAFLCARDMHGLPILYPPLHMHHTHVVPLGHNEIVTTMAEQHGDWIPSSGILQAEAWAPPHAFRVATSLVMVATVNDVRPHRSTPMQWWYDVALRTRTTTSQTKPLSKHYIWSPTPDGPSPHATFRLPAHGDSVIVFATLPPRDGTVVHVKAHAHMVAFVRAGLVAATPAQLGLLADSRNAPAWTPLGAATYGFGNATSLLSDVLTRHRDRVFCEAVSQTVSLDDGLRYDRAALLTCRIPRRVSTRDVLTTVSVSRGARDVAGAASEQHTHWWLTYVADDGQTHFSESFSSRALDARLTLRVRCDPTRAAAMQVAGASLILAAMAGTVPLRATRLV